MQVVRDNKDSLMAVLEAFVYDPLISWRLMQADVEVRQEGVETNPVLFNSLHAMLDASTDQLARAGYPQGPLRKVKADENEIFNGRYISFVALGISWISC